jgi:hypothetical protein
MGRAAVDARKPFNILDWLNGGRPGSYFRLGVLICWCSGVGAMIGYLMGVLHG